MIVTAGVWSDLGVGSYLMDPKGGAWAVVQMKDGWLQLKNPAGDEMSLSPQHPYSPVTLLVPTWAEALAAMSTVLGATIVERV